MEKKDYKLTKLNGDYVILDNDKIIAGIEGLPTVNLSLVADGIGWVDVEKLAENAFEKRFNRKPIITGSTEADSSWINIWINCFKQAQTLNEKKFSEEDVILLCAELIGKYKLGEINDVSDVNKIIDSYSEPKVYNVELEMEDVGNKNKVYNCSLIADWEPKITNNSITVTKIL